MNFIELPVSNAYAVMGVRLVRKNPFDRVLAAQADVARVAVEVIPLHVDDGAHVRP